MTSQAGELMPCPFCGEPPLSKQVGFVDEGYWAIQCESPKCGRAFSHADSEEEARAAWNTRTPPAPEREDRDARFASAVRQLVSAPPSYAWLLDEIERQHLEIYGEPLGSES